MGRLAKVFLTPYTVPYEPKKIGTQWQREDLVKTKAAPVGVWHNHEAPGPPQRQEKGSRLSQWEAIGPI